MRPSRILGGALAVCVIVSPYTGLVPGWTPGLATTVWFNALALIGLNLIFGVTGMLAFGQAAFMALPVYFVGILDGFGYPFALCVIVGVIGTLVTAAIMARVFVRLPGVYLAVGTLGFGYVVEGVARAFPNWTGGASGLVLARGRWISDFHWYVIAVLALLTGLSLYCLLVRGALWRRLRAIHHDELAAAVLGINVSREKERAFLIGSAFAIFAGLPHAYYVGVITPEDGGIDRSMEQLAMIMIGGPGHLFGPVVGAASLQWLSVATSYLQGYELLIYGAIFLVAVMYVRDGIAGWLAGLWAALELRLDGVRSREVGLPAAVTVPPIERDLARKGRCLEVRGVSKRFQGVMALQGVDMSVNYGEIYSIVGPNGAGKSTLFNIISGIESPTDGGVWLVDHEITRLPISNRAPLIGRSFQVARLSPELTVLGNVLVRLDQISPKMSEAQRSLVALEHIHSFGLGDLAHRTVRELSVGQHKLIDITRATVGDPALVLLDEPAVGLSEHELAHLASLLRTLKASGSAIVIVEHNIEFVRNIAERGIVLDSGRPIATGPIREILADPRVSEAYFGALA